MRKGATTAAIFAALLFLLTLVSPINPVKSDTSLTISIKTNKSGYCPAEPVTVYGNVSLDGGIVSEALIGVQVTAPPANPFIFRTYTIGQMSLPPSLNITSVTIVQQEGEPKSFLLKNESFGYFKVTVDNIATKPLNTLTTISVFDRSNAIIGTTTVQTTVSPGLENFILSLPLPDWIPTGIITVYANAYSDYPSSGGIPYCPEVSASFPIVYPWMQVASGQTAIPPQVPITNQYSISFRNMPQVVPGVYQVVVGAKSLAYQASDTTTYKVLDAQYPPQASFTYYSTNYYQYYAGQIYTNMSITFDASASTAEGNYTDYITNYHWDFGDGNVTNTTNPVCIKSQGYKNPGNYLVTLNVTDAEGLWCTTSKIIAILPPTGPVANFTWSPYYPTVGQTVTFDASNTQLGWGGSSQAAIVNYNWNFGDGNTTAVTTPTITHAYTATANYTVTLTVTDTQGKVSSIAYTIQVKVTVPGDVNGDGKVNLADLVLLAKAYGSTPGSPNWNPNADFNNDGSVGLDDLVILAKYYGTGT
jgi:PKD repeat protein